MSECVCDTPFWKTCNALTHKQRMTGQEQDREALARVREVIEAHLYVPSALRGVSRCACGVQFHGMPHDHRAHLAERLAEVVREAEQRGAQRALTETADVWQTGAWTILLESSRGPMTNPQRVTDWLRERARHAGADQ